MTDFIKTPRVGSRGGEEITSTKQRPHCTSKDFFNQGYSVQYLEFPVRDESFSKTLAGLKEKHELQAQFIRKLESLGGAHEQV